MQKYPDRSKKKESSSEYNPEIAHYKSKMKQYKSENSDLREQLQSLTTQYVKLGKDKDRYKQKLVDVKQDIARFDEIIEQKSTEKAAVVKKELRHAKRSIKKKDTEIHELEQVNKQLKNQLDEQNQYVMELEARVEKLLKQQNDSDDNGTDHQTPNKNNLREEIEMVNKTSLEEDDSVIVTPNNDSTKKHLASRKVLDYSSKDLSDCMESPKQSKLKSVSGTVGKVSKNTLFSSLPLGLRDTSYFDNIDQCRTLLGEKKEGGSRDKIQNKVPHPDDPSFEDSGPHLETDYDFE
ncbi:unnamed protein product [Moneuplotes crassus]|uniref:Uncharacterized protein n=1 Tax=Euplotes crassus TaxID=5936 RepID=A0AAD1XN73_EUPCR|nr:unnamed protein product [Moneuplotes crassus]